MKASQILSTALFALTLNTAAFANGAQEQTQESNTVSVPAPGASASVVLTEQAAVASTVSRSVLQRLQIDVRESVLGSLRNSGLRVLKLAAPALVEAASVSTGQLEMSSR